MPETTAESDTVTVYKLEQGDFGDFLAVSEEDIDFLVEGLRFHDPGTTFTVTVEEWSREEYEALPAWDGW